MAAHSAAASSAFSAHGHAWVQINPSIMHKECLMTSGNAL
jgi:hypothetical protein